MTPCKLHTNRAWLTAPPHSRVRCCAAKCSARNITAGCFNACDSSSGLPRAAWQTCYLLDELMEGVGKGLADQQVGLSLIIVGDSARAAVRAVCEAAGFGQGARGGLPGCICRHQVGHAQHFLLQAAALLITISLLHKTCRSCATAVHTPREPVQIGLLQPIIFNVGHDSHNLSVCSPSPTCQALHVVSRRIAAPRTSWYCTL